MHNSSGLCCSFRSCHTLVFCLKCSRCTALLHRSIHVQELLTDAGNGQWSSTKALHAKSDQAAELDRDHGQIARHSFRFSSNHDTELLSLDRQWSSTRRCGPRTRSRARSCRMRGPPPRPPSPPSTTGRASAWIPSTPPLTTWPPRSTPSSR